MRILASKATPLGHAGIIRYKTGLWYGAWGNITTLAVVNERLYCTPLTLPGTEIDAIGTRVIAAGNASSVFRLGIYKDNGSGYPGDLELDAGTVAADSTGTPAITVNHTVVPGLYWLAIVAQAASSSAPSTWGVNDPNPPMGTADLVAGYAVGYVQSGVNAALPATFSSTVLTVTQAALPKIKPA